MFVSDNTFKKVMVSTRFHQFTDEKTWTGPAKSLSKKMGDFDLIDFGFEQEIWHFCNVIFHKILHHVWCYNDLSSGKNLMCMKDVIKFITLKRHRHCRNIKALATLLQVPAETSITSQLGWTWCYLFGLTLSTQLSIFVLRDKI